jgi:hypothetical protein
MMGNIFFRGAAPSEILDMRYIELEYWSHWHDVMAKAEKKAASGS